MKLSYHIDKLTKPMLQQYGFHHNKIFNDWHLIVVSSWLIFPCRIFQLLEMAFLKTS
jgi:hypothetical protein